MKHLSSILAATMMAGLLQAAPAQAGDKFFLGVNENGVVLELAHDDHHRHEKRHYKKKHSHYDVIHPRRVRKILRRNGFYDIGRPEYRSRRDVYVTWASNRRGREVRVVVDAYTGDILAARPPRRDRRHY